MFAMQLALSVSIISFAIHSLHVNAASIWKRAATDDTVCDLSPHTTYKIALKPFVPADTKDSHLIYTRLVLRFASQNCKNGQTLILQSDTASSLDSTYFRSAAAQLCNVADIHRLETPSSDYPKAYEVRCKITKFEAAKEHITSLESQQTTEALIAVNQPQLPQEPKQLDPMCSLGKTMGSSIFCGNNAPTRAETVDQIKTDKPCAASIMTTTGCR